MPTTVLWALSGSKLPWRPCLSQSGMADYAQHLALPRLITPLYTHVKKKQLAK